MVAYHYAGALELTRASGGSTEGLVARARDALRDAGIRAASLNAVAQAERYLTDALELTGTDDPERVTLLFKLGETKYLRSWDGSAELSEARAGYIAVGDPESAAAAALMIADNEWAAGRGREVTIHLNDARSLVAGRPPSRGQAAVLTEVARYDMLADRNDSAIATGREALRMAEQLGLDDIRMRVLNNVGCARVAAGDPEGVDDLDESIAVASRLNLAADVVRGYNNRSSMKTLLGRVAEGHDDLLESYRLANHFGQRGFVRWADGGPMLGFPYRVGRWDEVLDGANAFIATLGQEGHYQAASSHSFRALIGVARGEVDAARDAERMLELARPVDDPQLRGPVLQVATVLSLLLGEEDRARELFDEALALIRDLPQLGWAVVELHSTAWVARKFARADELLEVVKDDPLQSPWLLAARAIAEGELARAADIFGEMGAPTLEAFYRLRAAEALVAAGSRAEADEQLRPALAFFRGVGANRYVREGEALLAASA